MPVIARGELEESPLADLHAIASELGIEGFRRMRREDLIDTILSAQGGDGASEPAPSADADEEREDVPEPRPEERRGRQSRRRPAADRDRESESEPEPEELRTGVLDIL